MTHRPHRFWSRPLTPLLALATLAVPFAPAAAVPAEPATVTGAPESTPSDPVLLVPGVEWVEAVAITEDAIYAIADCDVPGCALVRRSLEVEDDVVHLGPATLLARTWSMAADEAGLLAYVRSYDHRLVLDYPDGRQEVPVWGTYDPWPEALLWEVRGPRMVTDTGVVHLGMGEPIRGLPGQGTPITPSHSLGDTVIATATTEAGDATFTERVLATPVDGTSTGAPTELDAQERPWDEFGGLNLVGVAGDTVVWHRLPASDDPDPVMALRWHPWPGESTGEVELGVNEWPLMVTGDHVVLQHEPVGTETSVLTWLDVSTADGEVTRTATLPEGVVAAVAGPLVAYLEGMESDDAMWLVDADGREIVADQTPLELPGWFADVGWGNAFAGDIAWLVDSGVTRGYTDGTFRPRGLVSRQQMAAFLYRMAGEPEVDASAGAGFSDVPVDHPFAEPIAWLATAGITTGHTDGTFRPGGSVTRGQMAAFLARFAGQEPGAPSRAPFTDVPTGHTFAAEVAWLASTAITRGNTDGTFRPSQAVNRQHMAAFLHRFHRAGLTP